MRKNLIPINNKQIKNDDIVNTKIPKQINIDFRYFIYKSFEYKDFTNFYKDENDYVKTMNSLFRDLIQYCDYKNIEQLQSDNKHTHYVKNLESLKVFNIMKYCNKNNYTNLNIEKEDSDRFFQIYVPNGNRAICYLYNTTFYILFLDIYHLIYPDEKFNQDKRSFNYTPKLVKDINILRFDKIEIEHCYTCKHYKEYIEKL